MVVLLRRPKRSLLLRRKKTTTTKKKKESLIFVATTKILFLLLVLSFTFISLMTSWNSITTKMLQQNLHYYHAAAPAPAPAAAQQDNDVDEIKKEEEDKEEEHDDNNNDNDDEDVKRDEEPTTTTTTIIYDESVITTKSNLETEMEEDEKKKIGINNNNNSNNSRKYYNSKQQQQHPIGLVKFFSSSDQHDDNESDDDENCCWLNLDKKNAITLLGCGYHGHTFLVPMECKSNNSKRNRNVVLKVLKVYNGSFIDESESMLEEYKQLNQILFPPRTSTSTSTKDMNHNMNNMNNMRQHFHIPIGYVNVPVKLLYHSILLSNNSINNSNNINTIDKRCIEDIIAQKYQNNNNDTSAVMANNEEGTVTVTGTIAEVAKGQSLKKFIVRNDTTTKTMTNEWLHRHTNNQNLLNRRRLILINQLVSIWYYMYKHHFVHQDIQHSNIMFDGHTNITSLIDFTRYDILKVEAKEEEIWKNKKKKNKKRRNNKNLITFSKNKIKLIQINQLYQLMTLIGHICIGDHKYFDIPNKVSIRTMEKLLQYDDRSYLINRLQYSLSKCNLDDNNDSSLNLTSLLSEDQNPIIRKLMTKTTEKLQQQQQNETSSSSISSISFLLPLLLFDHYDIIIKNNKNNKSDDDEKQHEDNDFDFDIDDVIDQIYQILFQWTSSLSLSSSSS